jgi:hypothetical protein
MLKSEDRGQKTLFKAKTGKAEITRSKAKMMKFTAEEGPAETVDDVFNIMRWRPASSIPETEHQQKYAPDTGARSIAPRLALKQPRTAILRNMLWHFWLRISERDHRKGSGAGRFLYLPHKLHKISELLDPRRSNTIAIPQQNRSNTLSKSKTAVLRSTLWHTGALISDGAVSC